MSTQEVSVILSGDALITRPFRASSDPGMRGLVELVRSADVRFTNLEMLINRYRGTPVVEAGGLHLSASPQVAEDLLWAGFNLFANANNHSLDFGTDGLLAHMAEMDRLGMAYAGVGDSLEHAARPAYIQTGAGRAALVSCASSFARGQRAGEMRPDFGGRPGLNSQRFETRYVLDSTRFDQLRDMAESLKFEEMRRHAIEIEFVKPLEDEENELLFTTDWRGGGMHFLRGDASEIRTTPHKRDLERNLNSIRHARRQADLVIASIHAHELNVKSEIPASFIIEWARACVDAGADVVTASGPHMMRGIEVYNGKPIFYSLGNLWFEFETVDTLPADSYEMWKLDPLTGTPADLYDTSLLGFHHDQRYWECALPVCAFADGELTGITLHPVTLGFGQPRSRRGTPTMASPEDAERILCYVAELSEAFGTDIATQGGVGRITP
ncbi:MAG TPA: CapA family protein [Thermomicrobiales bacterium]|nr:CapA family protein [Thermomicrobiales bacterium]